MSKDTQIYSNMSNVITDYVSSPLNTMKNCDDVLEFVEKNNILICYRRARYSSKYSGYKIFNNSEIMIEYVNP